ncbi:Family taurine [Mycena venus]|uniref:Family taurine n=1 Tax=Mycena venus TaxID=2733690 RepID=A0A8H6XT30_9AGAR|nr:Family taurine [Mycena venus]
MDQDLDIEKQRERGTWLGELVGKPATSKLRIYLNSYRDSERNDELPPDVVKISSEGGVARTGYSKSARASDGWHSDACYEHVPSDYSILKMHTLPAVGEDTLWASGYEAYDKLSPAYQKFIEGLTAVHGARGLREEVMYFFCASLNTAVLTIIISQVGEAAEQRIPRSSRRA